MESCHQSSKRIARILCLLVCTALCALPAPAFSETKEISGTQFHIDEIRSTGAGYSTVRVGNVSELVADAQVNAFVVTQYFKHRDLFLTLSTKQVETFTLQSLEAGKIEFAALALNGLLEFGDATSTSAITLFEDVRRVPGAAQLFKVILPDLSTTTVSPKIVSMMVTTVGLQDLPWVREHTARLLYVHAAELRTYVRGEIYDLIKDQKLEEVSPLVSFMKEVFTAEDQEVQSLEILQVKLKSLSSGSLIRSDGTPLLLVDLAGKDPVLQRYLTPIYIDTVHQQALASTQGNDPERALVLLSAVELERRTPATHSLLIEALNQLPPKSTEILENRKVEDFILFVSGKDSYVKEAYLDCLHRMITARVEEGLLIEAQSIFDILNRVRPDPNSLNDSIRIESAVEFFKSGRVEKAESLLKGVRTGVSFINKLIIFYYKVLSAPSLLVFLFGGIFAVIAILWFVFKKILGPSPRERAEEEALQHQDAQDDEEKPAFVTARGRTGGMPREYLECLHEFGLTAAASMKEIKTAFRNRVKDIHPDHHQSTTGEDPAEFIRIKAVYERLLEIRKRMGLE